MENYHCCPPARAEHRALGHRPPEDVIGRLPRRPTFRSPGRAAAAELWEYGERRKYGLLLTCRAARSSSSARAAAARCKAASSSARKEYTQYALRRSGAKSSRSSSSGGSGRSQITHAQAVSARLSVPGCQCQISLVELSDQPGVDGQRDLSDNSSSTQQQQQAAATIRSSSSRNNSDSDSKQQRQRQQQQDQSGADGEATSCRA